MRRSNRGYSKRRINTREVRQRFLIYCEGERTEPLYFRRFRAPQVVVTLESGDPDPVRLIEAAAAHRRREPEGFDQVWCVFDRDDTPSDRFNHALQMAQREKIKVAYSNQAFELWLLLHFQPCTGALTRADYVNRLYKHLKRPYRKNDDRLYDLLEPYLDEAVERAQRLLAGYNPCNPTNDDPSTTVHLLVQELRRFAQP